jgi:hypothetical protein
MRIAVQDTGETGWRILANKPFKLTVTCGAGHLLFLFTSGFTGKYL